MISLLQRYQKPLFIAVIAIFLIGTFVGLGGYLFTSRDTSETVATVGRVKIPYSVFTASVNRYEDVLRGRGADVTEQMIKQIKQEMLRDLIVDELLSIKAGDMGLTVTDDELARDIQNSPAFQRNGAFDQETYFQTIRRVYNSPEAYERSRRKSMAAMKVRQLLFQSAKLAPEEVKQAYDNDPKKNPPKDFEKNKAAITAQLQQRRALDLINYYLRQLTTQIEVRTYLEQRETGA